MSPLLPLGIDRVLVIGGAGIIGGAVGRRLLRESQVQVDLFDKCGYASNLNDNDQIMAALGTAADGCHRRLTVDLVGWDATAIAVHLLISIWSCLWLPKGIWTVRLMALEYSSRAT